MNHQCALVQLQNLGVKQTEMLWSKHMLGVQ